MGAQGSLLSAFGVGVPGAEKTYVRFRGSGNGPYDAEGKELSVTWSAPKTHVVKKSNPISVRIVIRPVI